MTNREAFEAWTSGESKWASWVRPVPFVMYGCNCASEGDENHYISFDIPYVLYVEKLKKDTAIFVDRCGYNSVNEGLALAEYGWRPIPLYNGTNEHPGAMALVDNHGIECALLWGADVLKTLSFEKDAPPAFLLDSNRMHRYKMKVSVYDNSWDLYNQDIPSPEYFISNGIDKVIIVGEKIQKDLRIIFYEFQKKGIRFFYTDGYNKPTEVRIKKARGRG